MRNVARTVPTVASMFLVIMAVLINSPALFYMATAMMALIAACRIQAALSVRALRFERIAPPTVTVGETVTVGLIVWSERKLKRPLVTIVDGLPKGLVVADLTLSLPVAPSFDQPIPTRYSFRPLRRGKFKWHTLEALGTDALGLVTMGRRYETEGAELTVYPAPIPISIALTPTSGWGLSEAETGNLRGSGIEPRGVREYTSGDPLRYVHWASSARSGRLMVKEFETGAGMCALFVIQRMQGTEIGYGGHTTLEAMCGHTAYLAEQFMRSGAEVRFPTLEDPRTVQRSQELRKQEIYDLLASIQADQRHSVSDELRQMPLTAGGTLYVLMSVQDPDLVRTLGSLHGVSKVILVYDPKDYQPRRIPSRAPSAADPSYLDQLRDAGYEVHVMPSVESVA
ncbi:MAG TPA: DUF58 domain-containing protein [Fimbriimonadaceae bacterium]|mgnify:CR=1 FL=1|nr:DUF58 domain-containing protein [Fimbriimonadaceae bacterium]